MTPKMEQNDEMYDSPWDMPPCQPLRDALTLCRNTIEGGYHKADTSALRHQRYHRLVTVIAAIFGTIKEGGESIYYIPNYVSWAGG